jgi:hypothetical protein
MAIIYPDTIIFDPVQADYYNQEIAGETYTGGRLMNYLPHIDGLFMGGGDMQSSSANLVLTRNAKGDWSLNRTAAGAETYYVRLGFGDLLRIGETYNYGEFSANSSNQTNGPPAGNKGVKVLDIFVVMNIGVVALTTGTLRLGSTQYALPGAAQSAPVVTDVVAATALGSLAINTAGQYLTQKVSVATPAFQVSDLAMMEIELNIVMANTGTVQIAQLGAHVAFNYD